MPRLRRLSEIYPDAPVYFVTACTWQRQRILARPDVHEALRRFGAEGPLRGAWLGAYVLMPDHLHAMVAFDAMRCDLSRWMKACKAALAAVLRLGGHPGPVWQRGFFDHVLRHRESASEKWAYIRANPVRVGLARHEDDWPFQGQIHLLRSDDRDP